MPASTRRDVHTAVAAFIPATSALVDESDVDPSARYCSVRRLTEALAEPLSAEDQQVQTIADVSPTKWHRAHTTWFFETFVLVPFLDGYEVFDPGFGYLFNSYYEHVGDRHPRAQRGLLSRPSVQDIAAYRRHVDAAMIRLLADPRPASGVRELVELGLHHEQQHQELLLMDIKHVLSVNPSRPGYLHRGHVPSARPVPALGWVTHPGGVVEVGHDGEGFSFDNEGPAHDVLLRPFALADRLVTVGEWIEFIEDDGYRRSELWLSDGWAAAQREGWGAPLYWEKVDEIWHVFTLDGLRPVDPAEPVCHVSYVEADAYATWSGVRLPLEHEWEIVTRDEMVQGNLLESGELHPLPAHGTNQFFGDVWEWTASPYVPYPGFVAAPGAVGEYNGKFMLNQFVLRGGCALTPPGHVRATYRNFYYPTTRWHMSGVRLARDLVDGDVTSTKIIDPVITVHLGEGWDQPALEADVRRGLTSSPKELPPKWFYDETGSQLFDRITRLPEYYPFRCEREILRREAAAIARSSRADTLVELGSGTSEKTRLLLDAMWAAGSLSRYVPFDVSEQTLRDASFEISSEYPGIEVHGIIGDFERHLDQIPGGGTRLIVLLGGTIGNFVPEERRRFLTAIVESMNPGDHFLLGVDLVKDVGRLEAAYDDEAGVTAAFNRNVLTVINDRLAADFDPDRFTHRSNFDPENEWIEMLLVADCDQIVTIGALDLSAEFVEGEPMRTEISAKFRRGGVERELCDAGLEPIEWFTDPAGDFALSLARKC